jgi:signal transduction histidine kinase
MDASGSIGSAHENRHMKTDDTLSSTAVRDHMPLILRATDPLRLQQIITNLLSNAFRYTESGSIHIHCETQSDQRWCISIQDTGMGIAPADQSRIFEPYFRAGTSDRASESEGTGLGLAIVLRLVKLLQGDISVTSEVGVGSTFTVCFPLTIAGERSGEEGGR